MKELSVFIDESGDFGEYDDQAPYYIIEYDYSCPLTGKDYVFFLIRMR